MSELLDKLIEETKDHEMSAEEREEQKLSFVYGNSRLDDPSTKEEVAKAVSAATVPKKVA